MLPSRFSSWNIWSSTFICLGYSLAAITIFRIKPVGLISTQITLLFVKPPSALTVMKTSPAMQTVEGKLEGDLTMHLENSIVTQVESESRKLTQVFPKWMHICLFSASRSNPTSMDLSRLFEPTHLSFLWTLIAIIVLLTLLKTAYLVIYMIHIIVLYGLRLSLQLDCKVSEVRD